MNVLQLLGHEHRLIRQFLEQLSFAVGRLEHGERVPRELFENAVLFSREFVDQYHHFKEELQLFVLLAQKTGGKYDGPIEALRYQHERGRAFVTQIADSLPGYAAGDERSSTTLLEAAAAYVALLRQHIFREDHVFYPLAKRELGPGDHEKLLAEFHRADEKLGDDVFERNEDRLTRMAGLAREP